MLNTMWATLYNKVMLPSHDLPRHETYLTYFTLMMGTLPCKVGPDWSIYFQSRRRCWKASGK